ncbi:MAG: tRNA (cytidine(34)-2'-O)-methyltransferase [Acholeplasmatales bacterium]|jgi:tRNA (cytidine/uridine-2'-O-)-methyltransferase|nr:tRNA (cytidine(34)-2'-O)-methyltransferase [Acholeplasmatales bacterium]
MIHIILFEPEIPQNTGNIFRTSVATNSFVHLIKPLGFSLSDKYLKRVALDYFKDVQYQVYEDYQDFLNKVQPPKIYYLTRYGYQNYTNITYDLEQDIYLMFGKESTGISKEILASHLDATFRIPTTTLVRSLNLSNCVAIVVYELLRQVEFSKLSFYEPENYKGKDFLKNIKDKIN